MLLPEGRVDLEMRRPKFLLGFVGRGILEVGDRQSLACSAVPITYERLPWRLRKLDGVLLLEYSGEFGAYSAAVGTLVEFMLNCLRPPAHC